MTIKAHFDGKAIIPDEPVDLPMNQSLRFEVIAEPKVPIVENTSDIGQPLLDLLSRIEQFPSDPDAPSDAAAQHDHYLYGLPKRP